MAPTIYEQNAFLYGYDSLAGNPTTMEYLPTKTARKWRPGFFVKAYSEHAYQTAMALVQAGEIFAFRFV